MKTLLTKCQQVVGVHRDRCKDLMEEDDTYGASGVLFDGGKCYLRCVVCVMGLFVGDIFSSGDNIGKVGGLCVWVEMRK